MIDRETEMVSTSTKAIFSLRLSHIWGFQGLLVDRLSAIA